MPRCAVSHHCVYGTLPCHGDPTVPWGPPRAMGPPLCPSALFCPQNFLNSGSCPEVEGFLQLREPGRKVWKRFYFSLRRSGLYYSTKGTSKVRMRMGAPRGVQRGQPSPPVPILGPPAPPVLC